jgi:4-amino-4-deoxy-L-arabinose transferase-like glycosyltransferase
MKQRILVFFVFIALLIILFYGLFSVGLEYDELLSSNAALGCPNDKMFLWFAKYPKGICIPLMVMQYIGATVAIIPAIGIKLFGPSIYTFRGLNMFVVFVSTVFLFWFLKKRFNVKVALLTVFFLAFDAQFIFTQRFDRPTVLPYLLRVIFLYYLLTPKARFRIFLIGFLTGLMIYTKLDAGFFVLSVFLAKGLGFLIPLKNKMKYIKKKVIYGIRSFVILCFGFLVGSFPLLWFLQWFSNYVFASAKEFSSYHANELITTKLTLFLTQLIPSDLYEHIFNQQLVSPPFLLLISVLLVLIWIFCAIFLLQEKNKRWIGLIFLFFFIFYFFYSGFRSEHHRLTVYPFPQLVIALVLVKINKKWLIGLVILLYIILFIPVYRSIIITSEKTCGGSSSNCGITNLYEAIKQEKKDIVIGDWGMATQLLYLTKGTVPIHEIVFDIRLKNIKETKSIIEPYLKNCDTVILYSPKTAHYVNVDTNVRKILQEYPKYKAEKIYNKKGLYSYDIFRTFDCK